MHIWSFEVLCLNIQNNKASSYQIIISCERTKLRFKQKNLPPKLYKGFVFGFLNCLIAVVCSFALSAHLSLLDSW